jgi:hypothetical protein
MVKSISQEVFDFVTKADKKLLIQMKERLEKNLNSNIEFDSSQLIAYKKELELIDSRLTDTKSGFHNL